MALIHPRADAAASSRKAAVVATAACVCLRHARKHTHARTNNIKIMTHGHAQSTSREMEGGYRETNNKKKKGEGKTDDKRGRGLTQPTS